MKRLTLLFLLCAATIASRAHDFEASGIYYNFSSTTDLTLEVTHKGNWVSTSSDHYSGAVAIPSTVTYNNKVYSVTSIGNMAFYGCNSLTSISIPESVTSIGDKAFYKCNSLTYITIPESITSIGKNAFEYCSNLYRVFNCSNLAISKGTSSYGYVAYYAKRVLNPDKLTAIDNYEFYTSEGEHYLAYYTGSNSNLVLPNNYNGENYNIDDYAFYNYSNIASITIPESVASIGTYAFNDCNNLISVHIKDIAAWCNIDFGDYYANPLSNAKNLYLNGKLVTELTIPSSVTAIKDNAFSGCSSLASITIPESVASIGRNAFSGCSSLTAITIPESVASIGRNAFSGCSSLTAIIIPESVNSIEYGTFQGCSSLTSITVPNSITNIGEYAFNDCSSLTTITIPKSVTSIGEYAFNGCKLSPLYLNCHLGWWVPNFGWDDTSVIYLYEKEYNNVKNKNGGTYHIWDNAYNIEFTNIYMRGFSFEVIKNEDFIMPNELKAIRVNDVELDINSEGKYLIDGLKPNTDYSISLVYITDNNIEITPEYEVKTSTPEIDFSYKATNTTITIDEMFTSSDAVSTAGETGISIKTSDYKTSTYTYTGSPITIKNLKPNKEYTIYSYAYYGEEKVSGKSYKITTQSLTPQIELLDLTPTSFTAKGKYANIDATVNETGFTDYDASELLTLTGLDPSTKYTIEYYVKTKEGSNEKVTRTFTTPALEMTTLNPKVVSNSCAIVAATTNMSDEETNAGFQWRKYEAPETLPSSEGYAAIYDGQLEGYIKNLQATSFYNVRAFYKSTAGKYYYSDWVTFDPSDFSYFEPTVHTYPTEELTANSAKVKGYVLQGTDAITEQGFVYWPTGTNKANATRSVTVPENASIVIAKGQVMNVTLEGLTPSTTYNFCAFVTTASGTIYGEEHSFTTKADETGIELLESEQPTPTIIGYYDLNGRKLSEPQHGITIVRYSDGTARKILTE